jgi:hypothetical protein
MHTPGPWNLHARTDADKEILVEQIGDGYGRLECRVSCDDCDVETADANARLIAAAPELLEAAQLIVNNLHDAECPHGVPYAPRTSCDCNYFDYYRKLMAAIAKATRSPATV